MTTLREMMEKAAEDTWDGDSHSPSIMIDTILKELGIPGGVDAGTLKKVLEINRWMLLTDPIGRAD